MDDRSVPKVLIDYARYQKLLKAAADKPAGSELKRGIEAVSGTEPMQEKRHLAVLNEGREKTQGAHNVSQEKIGPDGGSLPAVPAEEADPAVPVVAETPMPPPDLLEEIISQVPAELQGKASLMLHALKSIKNVTIKNGVFLRGKQKLATTGQLLALYAKPFNFHNEHVFITKIQNRVKSFSYTPDLPEQWYKL